MLGNLFAGCKESPGETENKDGRLIKKYRGMGSKEVLDMKPNIRDYSFEAQGVSGSVSYSGTVKEFVTGKIDSLARSFRVINCKTIEELHNLLYTGKLRFERMSSAGVHELGVHSLSNF